MKVQYHIGGLMCSVIVTCTTGTQIFLLVNLTWFLVRMNVWFGNHWFEKGGSIGSMASHCWWFLLLNIKQELRMQIAEILFMNCFSLIFGLQNLCSDFKVSLFFLEMYPEWAPISNGLREGFKLVISVRKCWYFSCFNL